MTQMNPAAKSPPAPVRPRLDKLPQILWDSAFEAFVHTFVVLLMGSIALSVVGGLLQSMAPSLPPGFNGERLLRTGWAGLSKPWAWIKSNRFLVVFGVFFLLMIRSQWIRHTRPEYVGKAATRLQKVGDRFSRQWLGLLLGNAFGALLVATVLTWLQRFSASRIVWEYLTAALLPLVRDAATAVLGQLRVQTIGSWLAWYGENQFRFTFWVLYVASVCDDLGVPNLKTFARFSWRRLRRRSSASKPVSTVPLPLPGQKHSLEQRDAKETKP